MLKRLLSKRSVWLGAILLLSLAGVGFFPVANSDRWPEPDVKINPEFERNPPIAQEITLEYLDQPDQPGSTVVLTATFDAATVKRINGKYLAMNLGDGGSFTDPANIALKKDQLSYLRDDGYDHDETPGDGKYTKSFQLADLAPVQDFVTKLSGTPGEPRNTMSFVNRKMVDRPDFKNSVTMSTGKSGKVIHIYPPSTLGPTPPNPSFIDHSLMITNLCVVEDYDRTYNPCTNKGKATGVWTFGELMRQQASPNPGAIASDAQTIDFILKWLDTWNGFQIVNGDPLPARSTAGIVTTWQNLSAANGAHHGRLLLQNCPFKLLAIVNRIDLRGADAYKSGSAGEARFVFGLLDNNCNPQRMTVIFEYGVNKKDCNETFAWAQEWANLTNYKHCDPTYRALLEQITNQFTLCGTNPSKINESSLNQLRTDEIALGNPWELREFHNTGNLTNVTVKQEPALQYNAKVNNGDVVMLANWVNANSAAILTNTHLVPDDISGIPFLGALAHTESPPTGTPAPGSPPIPHHWDGEPVAGSPAEIIDNDTRFNFSLNTCSGCHGGETQTGFTHITPVPFGVQAPLSQFLTGDPSLAPSGPFLVPDAAGRPSYSSPDIRGFNDLWRRAIDLQSVLDNPCNQLILAVHGLSFSPISSPH